MKILGPAILALSLVGCAGEEKDEDEAIPAKADYPPAETGKSWNLEGVKLCLNEVASALIRIGVAIESVNFKSCDKSAEDVDAVRKAASSADSSCANLGPEVQAIIAPLSSEIASSVEAVNGHFAEKCESEEDRRECALALSVYRNIVKIALEAAQNGNCEITDNTADQLSIALKKFEEECTTFLNSDVEDSELDAIVNETQALSVELIKLIKKNCPVENGPKKIPEGPRSPSKPPSRPSKKLEPMPDHARDMRTPRKVQNSRRV